MQVATLYYRVRERLFRDMDRLSQYSDEATMRAWAIRDDRLRRRVQQALQLLGGCAHVLKLLPRFDVTRLSDGNWNVIYLGDNIVRDKLRNLLFPAGAESTDLPRVAAWRLPASLQAYLAQPATDLLVCGLPHCWPAPVLKQARYHFTSEVFVNHMLDISRPFAELLAGQRRREVRYNLKKASQAGFAARVTHSRADFELFHHQMYRPHIQRRYGQLAELGSVDEQWQMWMQPGELLLIEQAGRPVAGMLMRYHGNTCLCGDEGVLETEAETLIAAQVQTALWRFSIERAQQLGMQHYLPGWSLALTSDPVFRSKQRWGAVPIPAQLSNYPRWTFMARYLPSTLREHLNRLGLIDLDRWQARSVQLLEQPADSGGSEHSIELAPLASS